MKRIILFFILLLLSLNISISLNAQELNLDALEKAVLINKRNGHQWTVYKVIKDLDQQIGMSGRKSFPKQQGLLFVYPYSGPKQFWMPDTYFNLDIIFLDQNLKVVAVERNVPSHPGRSESLKPIYRTKTYLSQYILEIEASLNSDWFKEHDQLEFLTNSVKSPMGPAKK